MVARYSGAKPAAKLPEITSAGREAVKKSHLELKPVDKGARFLYQPQRGRRGGRVVEGAPLLREYTGNGIEGSNPFFSAIHIRSRAGFV